MSSSGALPGFRDFYPVECAEREHVFRAWRAVAKRYAFVEYDGPPLESLDLYTRKSGEEIVGQLYAFEDKGGRAVAMRPEMTPTFARMVAARANALRKPLRWFSVPQLFRYERAQKGRLREHFQLNVDIVGEPSEAADAELIAVAVDVMRELGLSAADVRVRVSDRRLLFAALDALGFDPDQRMASLGVVDKLSRQPREVSERKLSEAGVSAQRIEQLLALVASTDVDTFVERAAAAARALDGSANDGGANDGGANDGGANDRGESVRAAARPLRATLAYLHALGVSDWIDFDPTIVRGLAYYTGVVFELFDSAGEFRAICGGGRYDDLLQSLGGVDLPALGFGMGDVVLSELLRARKLMPTGGGEPGADFFVVGGAAGGVRPFTDALRLASALRANGFSVDYALSEERYVSQASRNQLESARKSGARAAIHFDADGDVTALSLAGRLGDAATLRVPAEAAFAGDAAAPLRDWLDVHATRHTLRQSSDAPAVKHSTDGN